MDIAPGWHIVAPSQTPPPTGVTIVIGPGAGFGDGTHPSTRLCLQAIAALSPRPPRAWNMLDFGSGSGILAVGAAKLGATVAAIDVDAAARAHAAANARYNAVAERITHGETLADAAGPFTLVVANILRPVLLAFAEGLTERLAGAGTLVLSGLLATDVPEVSVRYAALLAGQRPEIHSNGEWRTLAWRLHS